MVKRKAEVKPSQDFPHKSDPELVQACLDGDSSAWEVLILRYQRLIYSIPIKMGLSSADAADIFQSICLKLVQKLSTLRNQERLSSWLITSTTRESWRISARGRRENPGTSNTEEGQSDPMADAVSSEPLVSDIQIALEQQQIVREAVAGLPDRCREMISLLFYQKEKLKYPEIARRMNMPASSIGPTRARCLEKLKKALEGKF
ncbi:MAG TPA: sigma-70 family RNA polymerase sigma factor [Blastocatellia bacterium]|nr:sigma-70 family RNA polymerase sigma factor [Blastocatellia bacterium]